MPYLPRALGVFHGSLHVVGFGFVGLMASLKKHGLLKEPRIIASIVRETSSLLWNVGPFLLRALLPGHNPRGEDDPQWMQDWIAGHASLPEGALIPLVDTRNAEMAVPFSPRLPRFDVNH